MVKSPKSQNSRSSNRTLEFGLFGLFSLISDLNTNSCGICHMLPGDVTNVNMADQMNFVYIMSYDFWKILVMKGGVQWCDGPG